jgi:hypothetical protein
MKLAPASITCLSADKLWENLSLEARIQNLHDALRDLIHVVYDMESEPRSNNNAVWEAMITRQIGTLREEVNVLQTNVNRLLRHVHHDGNVYVAAQPTPSPPGAA